MGEIITGLIEQFLFTFPSKRNREIHKKFRLLRKETWFKELHERYGTLIQMNPTIRKFVEQTNIEKILKDSEKTKRFQIELETLLTNEKF